MVTKSGLHAPACPARSHEHPDTNISAAAESRPQSEGRSASESRLFRKIPKPSFYLRSRSCHSAEVHTALCITCDHLPASSSSTQLPSISQLYLRHRCAKFLTASTHRAAPVPLSKRPSALKTFCSADRGEEQRASAERIVSD